jgi:hypothetical protein
VPRRDREAGRCVPARRHDHEFGNGRTAFLFSHDGTLHSSSGDRTDRRSEHTFALVVDMVRTASQTMPERDFADAKGECVVQIEGKSGRLTAIECNALNRSQNAPYSFVLDGVTNVERKTFR